jgi:multicomponent Na+:H+ antiporter subunit E
MYRVLPVIALLFTYLALSASVGIPNVILGLLIALGALGLLRPKRLPVNWAGLPSAFSAMVKFMMALMRNVIASGIQVALIVLHPKLPIQSGIVAVPPESDSEIGQAIGAHAISLAPGELLIEMGEDGTMYIHSLDVFETERSVHKAQVHRQKLLNTIFDAD